MYLEHFGLARKPFSLTPDPAFLFASRAHGVALAMLEYGLYEQAGLTVLSGGVGQGKTTLLRKLLNEVDDQRLTVGLVNNTHESFGTLLEWACLAFNLTGFGERPIQQLQALQNHVISEYSAGRRCVLVIDEAQNLPPAMLEQVRLLTNINDGDDLLLHIVLSGQPELQEILGRHELRQLAQRITAECHRVDVAAVLEVVQSQKISGSRPEYRPADAAAVRQWILEHSGVDIDPALASAGDDEPVELSERMPSDEYSTH